MAERFDARLTVMFVNDPLLLAAAAASYGGRRRFVERTKAELATFVKQVMDRRAKRQRGLASVVSVGSPADEILRRASQGRTDLIVMGSHGLSGIPRAFFGSTTEQVLRRATVPVLAIPPSTGRRGQSGPLDFTRVVAPIDLDGQWQSDAIRAAEIAGEFDARLVLVSVLPHLQTPPWLRVARGSSDAQRIDKANKSLERVRTKLFAGLQSVSTSAIVGNAAHEIARLTGGGGALVVMSLRSTAGVSGSKRGSIAYHVLTHSATPVLALPRIGRRRQLTP
jgi:nucleotide-binding universal stress UspA family protein